MKKSWKNYLKNPASLAKKRKYQKEYNKKPSQAKKRSELIKINREKGTLGNGDGKDYDHSTKKMVPKSVNRGRKSGTEGDRKARGGKRRVRKKGYGKKG